METRTVVEEYLTELLGKECTATRQFIETLLKKWRPPSQPSPVTDQDPLLEVYHRPSDEELVLMAAKRPTSKHKKQEPQQLQTQRKNVCVTYNVVNMYFLYWPGQ